MKMGIWVWIKQMVFGARKQQTGICLVHALLVDGSAFDSWERDHGNEAKTH